MDTIIVILMCIMPIKADTTNRFTDTFDKADRQFNKEYRLDIEAMKRASEEAAREATRKTKCYLIKTK